MEDRIRKDIQAVIKSVIELLRTKEEKDVADIKGLSDHVIHNASIFQDEDSVAIAVVVYSISKIIERKGELSHQILTNLVKAYKELELKNIAAYRKTIKSLIGEISKTDSRLNLFIGEVIEQARIKKGFKTYEHGISLSKTAEIFGISQWDLMNYIGKTQLSNDVAEGVSTPARIKLTKRIFGLK